MENIMNNQYKLQTPPNYILYIVYRNENIFNR